MTAPILRDLVSRLAAFEQEAHQVLAVHEKSRSRIVVLENTYQELSELSISQDDLMRQALRCVENELYRAAHVMAWAAFMDFLEDKISSDGLVKLRALRPNWKGQTMAEMREYVPERQLVEATHALSLVTKNEMNHLVGLLQRRNDCAHPSSYYPRLSETLGYISEILQRIRYLQPKTL